ncbi:MAG: pyrrolo-quinoline quinone [Planctomycetaceae bacterium]|nr:pyrrolo-quinoline quinone [Planctomycetaceae bacterium]
MLANRLRLFCCVLAVLNAASELAGAESWPQFRGVNGSARSASTKKLPSVLAPNENVWKTPLPPGHSSPIAFGNHIFLTAVRDDKLFTIGLDRASGKIIWEAESPHAGLEQIHRIGSHAQATPATDGERVVSFFGSSGLFCYSTDGKSLWALPMGPFNNDFGAAISPIIVDDFVILCQDHDTDSFLMAINKRTGQTVWKTDRSEFPRNYCTPVIVEVDGKKQIVVAATLRVVGYDFNTGEELWTVRGIARAACSSPGLAADGTIFVASYAGSGERIVVEPFVVAARTRDKNNNGTLEESELEENGAIQRRFSQVDRDKTGSITGDEYEYFRGLFEKTRNVVVAIKPGGLVDVTQSRVVWEFTKFVPFIASPLYANGTVFLMKDGGILTSVDAKTGAAIKTKRLWANGGYYSSPVAGDAKVYLLNQKGELTVVTASAEWEVLSKADFGEEAYATPAIVDGHIYLRTVGHLYCFSSNAE